MNVYKQVIFLNFVFICLVLTQRNIFIHIHCRKTIIFEWFLLSFFIFRSHVLFSFQSIFHIFVLDKMRLIINLIYSTHGQHFTREVQVDTLSDTNLFTIQNKILTVVLFARLKQTSYTRWRLPNRRSHASATIIIIKPVSKYNIVVWMFKIDSQANAVMNGFLEHRICQV